MNLAEIEAKLTGSGGPFETTEQDVVGERMTVFKNRAASLRELLERSIDHGDKLYIVCGQQRLTFADHAARVASVARAFRETYGVRPGDRVAILAANCPEWIICFWATVSLGAVAVGLNGWWTRDEILYGIADCRPRLIVGDRKRLARVDAVELGAPVIEIESDFDQLVGDSDVALPSVPIDEDDPAVILYTSGTTGRPKGAVNSHRAILGFVSLVFFHGLRSRMLAAAKVAHANTDEFPDCYLINAPLFHLSGLYSGAVTMLASGLKTVWMAGRFDPVEVLGTIERERVTNWSPLGSMAPRVLNHPDFGRFDVSSVRSLGSGGAPVSKQLQQQLQAGFPGARGKMGLGYGLSECAGVATMNWGEFLAERPDSVGRPLPTVEIEIRDAAGRSLPDGEQGEIHIRGPIVMLEYWGRPDATAETILPGRWLRTGDIGKLEDCNLYVNSRARDMILRSAENIYPVEIEHRLESHPDVDEAAVIGVPNEELVQEVKAVVVPARGATIQIEGLRAHCAETLSSYKIPGLWEVRDQPLPRNAAGKVLKAVLTGDSDNEFIE
ncbi:MAG: class I adenylate-forming enzyme family protein [Myxococcota bacterium]